jgi:hypothetical protein
LEFDPPFRQGSARYLVGVDADQDEHGHVVGVAFVETETCAGEPGGARRA